MTTVREVRRLARERGAVILAHHYQREEIKEAADHRGDSLELARLAATLEAPVVVLAGVRFMAESAAILAPQTTVLLPVLEAGCPLADSITAGDVRALREAHPGVPVVAYVNTSAAVKAEVDACCTSANAAAVVRGLNAPRVIMVPDRNLAAHTAAVTGIEIIPWKGTCAIHQQVTVQDVQTMLDAHPGMVFLAHPECRPEVLALADEVASTTGIFRLARESAATTILVGTEEGVRGCLERENPAKTFFFPRRGMLCPNMKLTTLEDVATALREMRHRVSVPGDIAERARRALDRMVAAAG